MLGQLQSGQIGDILSRGLHYYLTDFMGRIYALGDDIARDFLLPTPENA